MSQLALRSNDELLGSLRRWAQAVEVLTAGPFGLPVLCAVGGGTREPAILITAGAHADETSGMYTAGTLLDHLETDRKVYVVPNRDPLGWEGFAAALSLAAGAERPTSIAASAALFRSAGEVLYEDGQFIVTEVGGLCFALTPPTPDTFGSEKIVKMLAYAQRMDASLASRLAGKRVIVPANAPGCDGRGVLERAYTVLVAKDGFLGSLNRYFGDPAAPAEVMALADLIDELKPSLTIDLHEGWNDAYYMFTPELPPADQELASRLESGVRDALRKRGLPTSSLTELVPNMPEEHLRRFVSRGDGRVVWRWPRRPEDSPYGLALMPYALRHGLAYQTEVGRWSGFERRVEYQRVVVNALIQELVRGIG